MSHPVSAGWHDLLQNLSWTATARRVTEVLFRTLARRHLARLDSTRPDRCQDRILRGLIHQARGSRFGRDHDFRRIRSIGDYRRLVPLHPRDEFSPLVSPAAPCRRALRTALALVANACPRADLFRGTVLLLPEDGVHPGESAGLHRHHLPALVRPYTEVVSGEDLPRPGERGWGIGPTCIIGSAGCILALADRMGVSSLREAWPALAAVVWTGRPHLAGHLRERVGPRALLLEMILRPEGPLAIEDPRLGGLRLLTNHSIYFEFLPVNAPRGMPRVGLDGVEHGIVYELLATSPAGVWSSRLGQGVCFERLNPPVVRFIDLPPAVMFEEAAAPRTDVATPSRGPYRPAAGTPAELPGALAPTPWSALAGRE
jgi:hypothetical protein